MLRESALLVPTDLDDMMNVVAGSLMEPAALVDALERITQTAREMVPRADYASISIRRPGLPLETVAPTDPLILAVDELQDGLREGPAFPSGTPEADIYSGNVALDPRWPAFGPQVARLGIASCLAITLHAEPAGHTRLTLYSRRRAAFGGSRQVAGIFVSHAKVALGYAYEVHTVGAAMQTRTVIGDAMDIVMRDRGLDEERAFEFLIRVSQRSQVDLRRVAARIIDTRAAQR